MLNHVSSQTLGKVLVLDMVVRNSFQNGCKEI
jgi:hypothetical protein